MSDWGKKLKLNIFGESHAEAIGVVISGLPAGEEIDISELIAFCSRRAPSGSSTSTKRTELDFPNIISGFLNGRTTGAPLCIFIENTDTLPQAYAKMNEIARPGHADYTAYLRYNGANDVRGSGHFSGRLTAPLVAAGGIAKQFLRRRGVEVGAHIYNIHGISDTPFDSVNITREDLLAIQKKPFTVLDDAVGEKMINAIKEAKRNKNSLGGTVECCAVGFPAGIGDPMFEGLENVLSSIIFGIPAVKGVEFGAGFAVSSLYGSESNDDFCIIDDKICTKTNNHGGILGGISSGMPIILRAAFKPTPSIAKKQMTVNFIKYEECEIAVTGRHDPCVVPRAVPCVEAATAFALLSLLI